MKQLPQIQVNRLDEHLTNLGFRLASNGAFYHKTYSTPNGVLNIGVICDDSNIYDLMAFARTNNISKAIPSFEKIYDTNAKAISSLSMTKIAGGLGLEGGPGGLNNVNLDESIGGPRWWTYESDEESLDQLESWITKQSRYAPEYLSVGQPLQIGQDEFTVVGNINGDVNAARLNRDRQEVFLEYVDNNRKVHKIPIPALKQTMESGKNDGDLAQELNKYQLRIAKTDGKSVILMRKGDTRGDARGIWEINGKESTPGFGYVDEDWKTSYSLHPELLDDPNWTSGEWSPGRTRSNII